MSAALHAVRQFRIRELRPVLQDANPKRAKATPKVRNPFLPFKNPESGRWAPPKYSLRRQAELVKQARASGTLHLLPFGPKLSLKELAAVSHTTTASTPATEADGAAVEAEGVAAKTKAKQEAFWAKKVDWVGEHKEKEVKGADVGNRLYAGKKRMFKGHKWERTLEERLRDRKMLMKDMDARIERFKTTYKRKTPSPISPARPVSYSKLPF